QVRQPLVAQPEPVLLHHAHHAEVVADQRAGDDYHQHPEDQVHEKALALRLALTDQWREEQTRADPAHPYPDDRRLQMHIAHERKWQEGVDGDAIKTGALGVVMRKYRAG